MAGRHWRLIIASKKENIRFLIVQAKIAVGRMKMQLKEFGPRGAHTCIIGVYRYSLPLINPKMRILDKEKREVNGMRRVVMRQIADKNL